MEILATVIKWEIWVFMVGLVVVVGYQLLIGRINTAGMLNDKESGEFSPARVQLLLFTFIAAGVYFLQVAAEPKEFPAIPQEMLYLLGGSNLFYLGGKGWALVSQLFHLKS